MTQPMSDADKDASNYEGIANGNWHVGREFTFNNAYRYGNTIRNHPNLFHHGWRVYLTANALRARFTETETIPVKPVEYMTAGVRYTLEQMTMPFDIDGYPNQNVTMVATYHVFRWGAYGADNAARVVAYLAYSSIENAWHAYDAEYNYILVQSHMLLAFAAIAEVAENDLPRENGM